MYSQSVCKPTLLPQSMPKHGEEWYQRQREENCFLEYEKRQCTMDAAMSRTRPCNNTIRRRRCLPPSLNATSDGPQKTSESVAELTFSMSLLRREISQVRAAPSFASVLVLLDQPLQHTFVTEDKLA